MTQDFRHAKKGSFRNFARLNIQNCKIDSVDSQNKVYLLWRTLSEEKPENLAMTASGIVFFKHLTFVGQTLSFAKVNEAEEASRVLWLLQKRWMLLRRKKPRGTGKCRTEDPPKSTSHKTSVRPFQNWWNFQDKNLVVFTNILCGKIFG